MTSMHGGDSNARDDVPDDPTDLSGGSWLAAAKRTLKEYKDDDLQDRAAALTYFGIQSIFPGLLVLVSLLGFVGRSATQPLIGSLSKAAPPSIGKIITSQVTNLQHSHAASGIVGIAGIVLALWSASNYVAAFMRASNAIYDVPEGRPIWKTAPVRLGVTTATMILLLAAAVIVVVTGALAQKAGNMLGIGSAAVTVWGIAKWPVLLVIIGLILAILFWASPNARHGFQWVSPGGFIAVAAAPSPPGIRSNRSPSPNCGTTARRKRKTCCSADGSACGGRGGAADRSSPSPARRSALRRQPAGTFGSAPPRRRHLPGSRARWWRLTWRPSASPVSGRRPVSPPAKALCP